MDTARKRRVVVMGLGYIGLPTAGLIASKGMEVLGVDINPQVVETINKGNIHIVEPDLEGLVAYVVNKGLLKAVSAPGPADIFIITVPTPIKENKEPDMTDVDRAFADAAPHLKAGNLVIIESTCPVGTTERCIEYIYSIRPELRGRIHMAYCPERVLPGNIIHELEHNDRVIGALDAESGRRAVEFYSSFVKGNTYLTAARTAEMCKLVENAYRDVNIAFANELSTICDSLDIDAWELIELANKHPRVEILQPGPGVGGHCIAVDPWFIVTAAPQQARLMRTAREINDGKLDYVASMVRKKAAGFKAPVVACLGLSFKADIDDLRESPALKIVEMLCDMKDWKLLVAEPHIRTLPPVLTGRPGVELAEAQDAVDKADVVVLLVNHKVFRNIDPKSLEGKTVYDTRGMWRRPAR